MATRADTRAVQPPGVGVEAPEPLRVLDPDGTMADGYEPGLDDEKLIAAWRLMVLSRATSERAVSLQRQGRLGTIATPDGQEAAIVGSALALDTERDWVVPTYREMPALIHMGLPLWRFLLYYRGHPLGNQIPAGVNLLPVQIALATQVPHAVGLAWGLRHQGSDAVVLTYFGEGASSEGDVHEAMNLAGVRRSPVVFLLQDNGWAISTPVSRQSATGSFALRAPGYGFPGELVDGNDLFAVLDATRRAVARARAGEGPTLIEARTYRLAPHNTADDSSRYADPADLEEARGRDPLARLGAYLTSRGLLTEETEGRIREEIAEEIRAAVERMESESDVSAGQLFEHVYADLPPRLERERRQLSGDEGEGES
jgi:TPP-dependent pyruvate/acetoin dehydrogenase alpha subunit